ncbi:MAG: MASE1 domain-containing protein [Agarilytica sp.]
MLVRSSHPLVHLLIAALAYYIAGQFGRLLAIPPGFASAVWPASGIALALILRLQLIPTLLGIALGSFILNLGIATNNFATSIIPAVVPTLFISSGAVFQALFGRVLFKRFCGSQSLVDSPKTVVSFVLLVSCIGCVASSSLGTSTLLTSGIISAKNYFFTWATWWIGDTIGVLLFTPLTLLLLEQRSNIKSRKLFVVLPIGCIFFLVLFVFFGSLEKQKNDVQHELDTIAYKHARNIEAAFEEARVNLQSFLAFYQSSNYVTEEEFHHFASIQLNAAKSLAQVSWIPISQNENPDTESTLDFERLYQHTHKPKAPINTQSSLNTKFPTSIHNDLKQSFNFGHLSIIGNESESSESSDIYVSLPVASQTTPEGVTGQSGIIIGLLTPDVFYRIIGDHTYDVELAITTHNEFDISWHSNRLNTTQKNQYRSYDATFPLENTEIRVSVATNNALEIVSKNWESWYILTGGLLIAAFLQMFILLITGHTETVEREVESKTYAYLQAKEQAEKLKIQAENANKVKSQFLANMNHELRTPLNAIIGFLRILKRSQLENRQQQLVERSFHASETLLDLVTQILDYSKFESGDLAPKETRFSLVETMEKLHSVFIGISEEKGIDFIVKLPRHAPDFLIGDVHKIEQILIKLVDNALKYTQSGYVEVSLAITESSTNTAMFYFKVQDSGIGIEEEHISSMFMPFNQLDNSTSRQYNGAGLGLTICKALVELLGGELCCTSVFSQGSEFSFSIPLKTDSDTSTIDMQTCFQEKLAKAS